MRRQARKFEESERVIADRERARERTMNRAVKLLAAKPRSVAELRDRLLEKPWTDSEIVDRVLEKLKEYNYLNDDQFAKEVATSKLRQRPQGRRRLQFAMSQKKIDKETAEAAVREAFEKFPEDGLIDLAIERRLRSKGMPQSREDLKKLYDHLLRQGFGFELVRSKLNSLPRSGDIDEIEAI